MNISAIYAVSENNVIGKDNQMPWHLPNDLKHFKQLTTGHTIVMGRKTWESLGKALPNRRNIVISRQENYQAQGAEVYPNLNAALNACSPEEKIFLIGGAVLFQEAFKQNLIQHIHQTLIHAEVEGDVFLPINENEWEITEVDARQSDEKNTFAYTFRTLLKK